MSGNSQLRDEHGTLIGGLVVFDYLQGIEDYEKGAAPPDLSSASYDLGRQRAAEKAEAKAAFLASLREADRQRMERMRELLSPEDYEELAHKIAEIWAGRKP